MAGKTPCPDSGYVSKVGLMPQRGREGGDQCDYTYCFVAILGLNVCGGVDESTLFAKWILVHSNHFPVKGGGRRERSVR